MRIVLVNPNTSVVTTQVMVEIARTALTVPVVIEGLTARDGAPLITDPEALAVAAEAVAALADALRDADGVIVSGFGDPGLEKLRAVLACPVTGIAEAAMSEAAAGDRRFAVVTITPKLVGTIADKAAREGHRTFAGTWVTPGEPAALMSEPQRLADALAAACAAAMEEGGAECIVIGGGPLAVAARGLADKLTVPIIEPVPAAVRLALARLRRESTK